MVPRNVMYAKRVNVGSNMKPCLRVHHASTSFLVMNEKKEKERPSMPAHFPTFPQVPLLRVVYLKLAHPTPWVSFSHSFQLALVAGTPVTPTSSSLRREAGLTHMRVQRFCSTINTSRITSLRTSHPTRWCSRGDAIRRANISFRRSR